jgi:hypothetical protein
MNLWKSILFTTLAFVSLSAVVTFSACEKDSCLDLTCKNGGTCADGFCRCKTGFTGTECELKVSDPFVGVFIGNVKCDQLPPLKDTVEITLINAPDDVRLVQHSKITDTLYGKVVGINVQVPEVNGSDARKSYNVTSNGYRLTLTIENITNLTTGQKTVCQFIGYK